MENIDYTQIIENISHENKVSLYKLYSLGFSDALKKVINDISEMDLSETKDINDVKDVFISRCKELLIGNEVSNNFNMSANTSGVSKDAMDSLVSSLVKDEMNKKSLDF